MFVYFPDTQKMLICLFWAALFMPVVLPHCRGSEMTDAEDAMCTTTLQRQWNDRCRRCDVYYHTAEAVKWQMQKMRCVLCVQFEKQFLKSSYCYLNFCLPWSLSFQPKFYFVVLGHFHRIANCDYLFHHVRPSAWNNSAPLDGFSWNLIFECFLKINWENSCFIKSGQE